ncbi:MAG TPA: acyl-CoA dehydrogenase family protein [Bryobacteraceae bacterium]
MNLAGGAFLVKESTPGSVFTPEDLCDEHLAIARTAEEFFRNEIAPNVEGLLHQEPGLGRRLLRKSAELGLTGILIPEQFGGLELDLPSALVAAQALARDASYSAWHGAHSGIGTLPILYFGTEEQKRKYLPRLASAEMIAAYALTEPQAGSDAQAARTRADLTANGTTYILNGQKMWITNGGDADLFTVFAKVGGEKLTAFLVERAFGGVSSGAEEKKMGLKGSSTTAIYFENVPVPAANVLGEIGRGHIIAFNILNIGRLKLGTTAVAGAKRALELSIRYAKERKAFGSPIAEFGAIRHKLAEMAVRIYAAESMAWRTAGLIQAASGTELESIEEYAIECSMVKVYGSEALDYAADEGVQIHGGYGYHQDYEIERIYRDSRINRIFEGTNEINRLLIPGMLLKRAARGKLNLSATIAEPVEDEETRLLQNAKQIALLTLGLAAGRYGTALDKQQEILMCLADTVMEVFAMESSWLRARKTGLAAEICAVFLRDAMARIQQSARCVLGACTDGEELRSHDVALRRLTTYEPVNAIALRRKIAEQLLARGRY